MTPLGRCSECGDRASLVENDDLGRVCPACDFSNRHPEEPPLY